MPNPSFFYNPNPMVGNYGFNYNVRMNLPSFIPFNQPFPSILPQMQGFGTIDQHQPLLNPIHYESLTRRSNYAFINHEQ